MAETLEKLRPDRDLQCYFFIPSAVAALSGASENGFTLSGSFRQQFDWAVVEWNRDNTFEHPAFRYLPDGDLSGLTLSYQETRTNCVPMDSDINPTVAWPSLRIWADAGSGEQIYFVPLAKYATVIAGAYQPATVQLTLQGTVTGGDYVGFSFLDEHYTYQYFGADPLSKAIEVLVYAINNQSPTSVVTATQIDDTTIQLQCKNTGLNGNRIGVYTYVSGSGTEQWDAAAKQFSGGASPATWQVTIPFSTLSELPLAAAKNIRKMRWTYAADLQAGAYQRSEFQVAITNWTVTGTGREYSIAGLGSRRIEDDDPAVQYANPNDWTLWQDNFSGGSIHYATEGQASFNCKYYSPQAHSLYLGVLRTSSSGTVQVSVDGGAATTLSVAVNDDNVLARLPLGQFGPGNHTVSVTNGGAYFYFDFIEIAIPTTQLPVYVTEPKFTLATDWDTYQSLSIAPERTAWMINSLGFKGRVNHYVGALWFYELVPQEQQYASATVTFNGPVNTNSGTTSLVIGEVGGGPSTETTITHLNLIGDTPVTLAKAFELLINGGYTAIRAEASGSQLTIFARAIGSQGNQVSLSASPSTAVTSGSALAGGSDGNQSANGTNWFTDLSVTPRINRAARDWHSSFFKALKGYGIDVTASFSMELGNGDPSVTAGMAQRHSTGEPVVLNTPSLQTNFSPTSIAFWQQVYADMAAIQNGAGVVPYLQFGEVQWWYFPYNIVGQQSLGMPFYDAYTTSAFQTKYGYPLPVIATNDVIPSTVSDAAAFLPGLIGAFTQAVMGYVLASYPNCRFEVLYPTDVNNTSLNEVINYPTAVWTPQQLTCLKTESFSYTFERNLDMAAQTIATGVALGFLPSQRSHLVGLEMASTAWLKEARLAEANALDSVVLFALDQFCLIGYAIPLGHGMRRSSQFGQ